MPHTRANHQVTIMRRTFPAALAAALLLSLPPLVPAAAQTRNDSAAASRDRARAERDAERESERAQRDAERATERMDRDDDDDDDRGRGSQERTSIDTTVSLTRGGVVDLSLISGEIRVVGWTRGDVKVSARSEGGRLRFEATPSRVSLDIEHQGGRHNHNDMDATYDVSVPTGTRVLMRGVSGDLSARGVKGEIEARSVSGEVQVEDAGRVTLESVSGDVRATRVNGEARAHSVSGEVSITDVVGDLDAESVSGDVTLRRAKARTVRVETVSGEVTYEGSVDPAGRYEFNSHSGDVRLILPANTNAALSLETFSGDIDSAFPLTVRPSANDQSGPGKRARRMEFTLGSGGPRITAESFSGEITIERAGSNSNR
jgi:hypothetical protein